jgi:hypothetical protein
MNRAFSSPERIYSVPTRRAPERQHSLFRKELYSVPTRRALVPQPFEAEQDQQSWKQEIITR